MDPNGHMIYTGSSRTPNSTNSQINATFASEWTPVILSLCVEPCHKIFQIFERAQRVPLPLKTMKAKGPLLTHRASSSKKDTPHLIILLYKSSESSGVALGFHVVVPLRFRGSTIETRTLL